jgi:hypothetical protein
LVVRPSRARRVRPTEFHGALPHRGRRHCLLRHEFSLRGHDGLPLLEWLHRPELPGRSVQRKLCLTGMVVRSPGRGLLRRAELHRPLSRRRQRHLLLPHQRRLRRRREMQLQRWAYAV